MFKKITLASAGLVAAATPSFAAVDLTAFAVDVTQVEAVVSIVIVGLGVMWGIRKLIKTVNRSQAVTFSPVEMTRQTAPWRVLLLTRGKFMKPLNLLAFLFGLFLPFITLTWSYALDCPTGSTCMVVDDLSQTNGTRAVCKVDGADYTDVNWSVSCGEDDLGYVWLDPNWTSPGLFYMSLNGLGGCSAKAYPYSAQEIGGTCGPDEPSTCSNYVKDADEIGIDCGGSCSADCVQACPDGYILNSGTGQCETSSQPDNYNNCPSPYHYIGDDLCFYSIDSTFVNNTYTSDDVTITNPTTLGSFNASSGTFSTSSSTSDTSETYGEVKSVTQTTNSVTNNTTTTTLYNEQVTSNGDGTETATTYVTKTFNNGTTEVVYDYTITRPEGSAEGTGIITDSDGIPTGVQSVDLDGDGTTDTIGNIATTNDADGDGVPDRVEGGGGTAGDGTSIEENPENYDFPAPAPGEFGDMVITDDDLPTEDDWLSWFNSEVSSNSVTSLIEGTKITTASPVCKLSGVVMDKTVDFTMCGTLFTDAFSIMGNILLFISFISSWFIIVGRS